MYQDHKQWGKTYLCVHHTECTHEYRIQADQTSVKFIVQDSGDEHNLEAPVQKPARGIHPSLKPKVDLLLNSNVSAGMILSKLQMDPNISHDILPTKWQIIARGNNVKFLN